MPPRTVPYLPPEVMSLIYAGMNQRNAKTLRTLGRKGNAAAAARGRELSREKKAKKSSKGRGLYHGPYERNFDAEWNNNNHKNLRIMFSRVQRPNSPAEVAGRRRYRRALRERNQGRTNALPSIQVTNGKATKTLWASMWVGKVVKAANGRYYESRGLPSRNDGLGGWQIALWHRLSPKDENGAEGWQPLYKMFNSREDPVPRDRAVEEIKNAFLNIIKYEKRARIFKELERSTESADIRPALEKRLSRYGLPPHMSMKISNDNIRKKLKLAGLNKPNIAEKINWLKHAHWFRPQTVVLSANIPWLMHTAKMTVGAGAMDGGIEYKTKDCSISYRISYGAIEPWKIKCKRRASIPSILRDFVEFASAYKQISNRYNRRSNNKIASVWVPAWKGPWEGPRRVMSRLREIYPRQAYQFRNTT